MPILPFLCRFFPALIKQRSCFGGIRTRAIWRLLGKAGSRVPPPHGYNIDACFDLELLLFLIPTTCKFKHIALFVFYYFRIYPPLSRLLYTYSLCKNTDACERASYWIIFYPDDAYIFQSFYSEVPEECPLKEKKVEDAKKEEKIEKEDEEEEVNSVENGDVKEKNGKQEEDDEKGISFNFYLTQLYDI